MRHNISARGILEIDDKILFVSYKDSKGILYALPGGSQIPGEDLRSTVKREFLEETSLNIETHEVLMVREFILPTSELVVWKDGIHQVEIIFRCTLKNDKQMAAIGTQADIGMEGVHWLNKYELKGKRVFPTEELNEILERGELTYLLN